MRERGRERHALHMVHAQALCNLKIHWQWSWELGDLLWKDASVANSRMPIRLLGHNEWICGHAPVSLSPPSPPPVTPPSLPLSLPFLPPPLLRMEKWGKAEAPIAWTIPASNFHAMIFFFLLGQSSAAWKASPPAAAAAAVAMQVGRWLLILT